MSEKTSTGGAEDERKTRVVITVCLKYVRVQDGLGMPVEWALRIVVPIFKGKGDIRNCSCYKAASLREHAMKVVEKVLCRIVYVD